MANKVSVPLAFGVGHFTTKDPSRVQAQREIVEVLREKKIRIIDTARHYVSHRLKTPQPLIDEFSRVMENQKRQLEMKDWPLSSR
jgi:hypothetical protein